MDTSTVPDWSVLKQSAVIALIAAVVLVAAVVVKAIRSGKWNPTVDPGDDWNFKESWATNVTVGGSALVAVFGSSDVATAVGGEDAAVAPLIVVASALALAVSTAAPLLVKAFAGTTKTSTWTIAVAAVATLWAAGFQGLVIVRLATGLNLGGIELWTPFVGGVVGVLLVIYAVRSLWTIVTEVGGADFVPRVCRHATVL